MNAQTAGCRRQVVSRKRPAIRRRRRVVAEHVLERRRAGAVGVGALRGLGQLLRVAEQHEGARGPPIGRRRERHLSGLVDEEHVDAAGHVLAGEKPLVPPTTWKRRASPAGDRPRS